MASPGLWTVAVRGPCSQQESGSFSWRSLGWQGVGWEEPKRAPQPSLALLEPVRRALCGLELSSLTQVTFQFEDRV